MMLSYCSVTLSQFRNDQLNNLDGGGDLGCLNVVLREATFVCQLAVSGDVSSSRSAANSEENFSC